MPPEPGTAPVDSLRPAWQAPGVGALMTTRRGGVSQGAFAGLNLRHGLGDELSAVDANLALLRGALDAPPVWLRQVHGRQVVRLTAADALPQASTHEADASVSTEPGVACAVQVADCLPLLFAAPSGRGVAAAHAGWRGLSLGVVEATLNALCDAAGCSAAEVQVWLGACIGPRRFEVGPDVLQAFGVNAVESPSTRSSGPSHASASARASARFQAYAPGKWMADLAGLARDRLAAAGVQAVSGGNWCTVEDPSRFFSYRRDGVTTGRMAAAIWLRGER